MEILPDFKVPGTSFFSKPGSIRLGSSYLSLGKVLVMGILNLTEDSFFDGGKYLEEEEIRVRIRSMIDEGADIIDLGAASSRPGAGEIPEEIELKRLMNAMALVREEYPLFPISVDTYRSVVVNQLFDRFGSFMVNDISAGNMDENIYTSVCERQLPYVMMHMKGRPQTMQQHPVYKDVVNEISRFFSVRIQKLTEMGIKDLIIDPGFGFGKTIEHNYEILSRLDEFKIFELPVLVGLSRKSMIYKVLDSEAKDVLPGTLAAQTLAVLKGVDILRVHDVGAAKQLVRVLQQLPSSESAY